MSRNVDLHENTCPYLNPSRIQIYTLQGHANFSYQIQGCDSKMGNSKTFEHFHGLILK